MCAALPHHRIQRPPRLAARVPGAARAACAARTSAVAKLKQLLLRCAGSTTKSSIYYLVMHASEIGRAVADHILYGCLFLLCGCRVLRIQFCGGVHYPARPPPATPLPAKRPRALTQSRARPANPQLQSSFFSRLPAELRLRIYHEVLGSDAVLHIEEGVGKLRHMRCFEPSPEGRFGFRHRCWWWKDNLNYWYCTSKDQRHVIQRSSLEPDEPPRRRLSLLQTCRLIYSEAVNILYSSNTFHFRRTCNIIQLAASIVPQRLDAFRRLHLSTAIGCVFPWPQSYGNSFHWPPDDLANWDKACDTLSRMRGLEDLDVELAFWASPRLPEGPIPQDFVIDRVLVPLKSVDQGVRRFQVVVTVELGEQARMRLGETPYTLIQREGHDNGHR